MTWSAEITGMYEAYFIRHNLLEVLAKMDKSRFYKFTINGILASKQGK